LLAELIPKYVDTDLVRVVNGGAAETTKVRIWFLCRAASSLHLVDGVDMGTRYVGPCVRCSNLTVSSAVLYTGGGRVGKIIAGAGAKTLTPVSLEVDCHRFSSSSPLASITDVDLLCS
jgi:aldehyde dehydrogenase (NAD+)/aldehyde dehydrogenase (NAD(P)+)